MGDPHAPQFGALPPGERSEDRPGGYGVVFDAAPAERILLVRWRQRHFLPGGGTLSGEAPRQAFIRELLEETGLEVRSMTGLAVAGQYVYDATAARWWNKRCKFFVVRAGRRTQAPAEHDHEPVWVPAADAPAALFEEASSWAVTQALQRRRAH